MSRICARCGEEIARANLLDAHPQVDRKFGTVNGVTLTSLEWRMFQYLLLRATPVGHIQCETYVWGKEATRSSVRQLLRQLRSKLVGSAYSVETLRRDDSMWVLRGPR